MARETTVERRVEPRSEPLNVTSVVGARLCAIQGGENAKEAVLSRGEKRRRIVAGVGDQAIDFRKGRGRNVIKGLRVFAELMLEANNFVAGVPSGPWEQFELGWTPTIHAR